MTISYTYDGSAITHDIAPSTINIPTRADMGEAAFGGIPIEDPDRTLAIVGHKPFIVEESACSQPRLYTGWTTQRDIGRSEEEGMFVGPDANLADMTIADLNILFNLRIIRGGGTGNGNRPSETWDERLAWIMGDDSLDGLIEITEEDNVISRNLVMDEADYRGQNPSAVFDDLLQRPPIRQLTYFAYWDVTASAIGLFFHELGEATNDSTLSISNDLDDVNGTTCFAPWMDTTLARKPDQVYSEVLVEYPGGRTFRSRQSTEDEYGRRGTQISRPYCKSQARAQEYAEAFLDRHDSEEDVITTQILVPASAAGLVMAGQRIDCKFTHLGYTEFTSFRVTECKPTPATDIGDLYLISLELVVPKETSHPTPEPEEPDCSYVAPDQVGNPSSPDIWGATYGNTAYTPGDPHIYSIDSELPVFHPDYPYELYGAPGTTGGWGFGSCLAYGPFSMFVTWVITLPQPELICYLFYKPKYATPGAATVTMQIGSLTLDVETVNEHSIDPPQLVSEVRFTYGFNYSGGLTALSFAAEYLLLWSAGSGVPADAEEDVGPTPGDTVVNETPVPVPDGSEEEFVVDNSYLRGSLHVYIDGILIPASEVTETDPAAGTFTLSWAPDVGESITVLYIVG